jgi:cellulose synthase/poly-beta-1,6-N-acetylglucosamine synthase-like glycosyltransferase
MSGTVGIVAGDTGRYTLFSVALTQMISPPNTKLDWALSTDIAGARNSIVQRALDSGSEWVFFMDDDHVYPADILTRLLKHEKDMVCAMYLRRAGTFSPVAASGRGEDGLYDSIDLTTLPDKGLLKIWASGGAGMLIKSEVFRAISDQPDWFEYGRVKDRDWHASEDFIFCEKVQEAGFDIFLDLEAQLGHLAPCAIWPSWVDQEWAVGFSVADGLRLYCPIEKAAAAADAVKEAISG